MLPRSPLIGKSPIAKLAGQTHDSFYFRFHWWELIWFLDSYKPFLRGCTLDNSLALPMQWAMDFITMPSLAGPLRKTCLMYCNVGWFFPRYPNENFVGGVEHRINGSCFPTPIDPVPAHLVDGLDPTALPLAKAVGEEWKRKTLYPLTQRKCRKCHTSGVQRCKTLTLMMRVALAIVKSQIVRMS